MGLKDIIYDLFTEKLPEPSTRVYNEYVGNNTFLARRYNAKTGEHIETVEKKVASLEFGEKLKGIHEETYSINR